MHQRDVSLLIAIVLLTLVGAWIVQPNNPGIHIKAGPLVLDRDIRIRLGLDLQGGMEVFLEAAPAEGQEVTPETMQVAKSIVEKRVNSLGVVEPLVQQAGGSRIIVQLPGIADPDYAIATFQQTGLLEFVDAGLTRLPVGARIKTSYHETGEVGPVVPTPVMTPTEGPSPTATATQEPTATPTATAALSPTPQADLTPTIQPTPTPAERVFHTVMTGKDLKAAVVALDDLTKKPEIHFQLTDEGAKIFAAHTAVNVGRYLAIVLDGEVISCPVIETAIPEGSGRITGDFPLAEAQSIVIQLRYGALPVPLKIISTRQVGPTLGQDSIHRSTTAGIIGVIIVLAFMLVYYRLPGALADIALVIYGLVSVSLFKLIPVTLTLPGITGFLLSVGMAVDANILIFERMKEELRRGRALKPSIEAGFARAWTSIRDSNISTLITCAILWGFGSNFGASVVQGFAVTLFIGVAVSMFTAIVVTRTLMRFAFALGGERLREVHWLLGA